MLPAYRAPTVASAGASRTGRRFSRVRSSAASNNSRPRSISASVAVNGGQLLLRWTNDSFLATPHRAVNRTGGERYALAFFCDAQIDWPIAAVPTCVGPLRPPRYETTYYTEYMIRYQARTYNVFDDQAKDAAE